jgi:hypothetical protein
VFLLTGTASIEKINLFFLNNTHTLMVMTFKKYSIKSHYKVNKLVRIKKISNLKNLSDNVTVFSSNETYIRIYGKKIY